MKTVNMHTLGIVGAQDYLAACCIRLACDTLEVKRRRHAILNHLSRGRWRRNPADPTENSSAFQGEWRMPMVMSCV